MCSRPRSGRRSNRCANHSRTSERGSSSAHRHPHASLLKAWLGLQGAAPPRRVHRHAHQPARRHRTPSPARDHRRQRPAATASARLAATRRAPGAPGTRPCRYPTAGHRFTFLGSPECHCPPPWPGDRSAGMMREAPTHALLQWFRGGSGVVSGPGTRPDPRSGRRRQGCPFTGVSAGSQSWHPPALPV